MFKARKRESFAINWKNRYQEMQDKLKDGPLKVYKLPLQDKTIKSTPQ